MRHVDGDLPMVLTVEISNEFVQQLAEEGHIELRDTEPHGDVTIAAE